MIEVNLTLAEMSIAAQVGVRRNLEAINKNLRGKHGFDGSAWTVHIEGAAGEMAVAKTFGIYWDGSVNTFKNGGDVQSYQVRTRSNIKWDLIVRDDDRDDDTFILVVGQAPRFFIVGSIVGRDAKKNEFLQSYGNRPEAWFVPQSSLRKIEAVDGKVSI